MKQVSTIDRTYHPKYTTYTGDGCGRDGYIVFGNGGLHALRDYKGPQPASGFKLGPNLVSQPRIPKKEPTAFDYIPDGSGRDLYVINQYGLKRNYRSNYKEFEKILRQGDATPQMDAIQLFKRDPNDFTKYNNWPTKQAVRENARSARSQRECIERLSQSPYRRKPQENLDLKIITDPKFKRSILTGRFPQAQNEKLDQQNGEAIQIEYQNQLKRRLVCRSAMRSSKLKSYTDVDLTKLQSKTLQNSATKTELESMLKLRVDSTNNIETNKEIESYQQTPSIFHTRMNSNTTQLLETLKIQASKTFEKRRVSAANSVIKGKNLISKKTMALIKNYGAKKPESKQNLQSHTNRNLNTEDVKIPKAFNTISFSTQLIQ